MVVVVLVAAGHLQSLVFVLKLATRSLLLLLLFIAVDIVSVVFPKSELGMYTAGWLTG